MSRSKYAALLIICGICVICGWLFSGCASSNGATPTPTPTPPPTTYDLTATWTANSEDDIAGYQLWEVVGGTNVKVGPLVTGTTEIITGVAGGTHTYVLTAQNTGGLVSDPSNPATVTLPLKPSKPGGLGITWKVHQP